jgi:hypothetical protein
MINDACILKSHLNSFQIDFFLQMHVMSSVLRKVVSVYIIAITVPVILAPSNRLSIATVSTISMMKITFVAIFLTLPFTSYDKI